jgi:hypothetical protein
MGAAKIQQRRPKSLIRKGLPKSLPTSVQKSYFLLGAKERDVINRPIELALPSSVRWILLGQFFSNLQSIDWRFNKLTVSVLYIDSRN